MRLWVKILLIGTILIVAWVMAAPILLNVLIVQKPLLKADAIIVLSGSAAYKERTRKAAELYRRGVAPQIYITDDGGNAGWSSTEQRTLTFVEREKRELMAAGVGGESIVVLPGEVSGTDHEAKALLRQLDKRPLSSLMIITSSYHTRRALRTFEKILEGRGIEIGIDHVPVGENPPFSSTWWLTLQGWQIVGSEYTKTVVYWLLY